MGFFTRKKDKVNQVTENDTNTKSASFVMGVLDVFQLKDCDDIVVVGKVKGTVRTGAPVYVSNLGEDEDAIFLTTVLGIEMGPNQVVEEASDCQVGLKIEKGKSFHFKKGTVLYSREQTAAEVHNAYISALGDIYVVKQNLTLSDADLEALSITDCAEIWRLFS